eukprot:1088448-Rhodomonas_salina.1
MDKKQRRAEEEKVALMLGEKKNRPGQRTRRKMIMQKYGKDAKVFKEARERKYGAKKDDGGTEGPAGGRSSRERGREGREKEKERGAERAGAGSGSEAAVHGSWEAKRREKEAMALALAGGGSGKKITFDDEGEREHREPPKR